MPQMSDNGENTQIRDYQRQAKILLQGLQLSFYPFARGQEAKE